MVYRGPSRGCYTCRRRRVKCDERRPECGNCVKRKQTCTGYRNLFDAIHVDETAHLPTQRPVKRARRTITTLHGRHDRLDDQFYDRAVTPAEDRLASASTPLATTDGNTLLLYRPARNIESESLSYFFSNYVNTPRDPSTNIFIEHILPQYLRCPANSPLTYAVKAVAMAVTHMWLTKFADSGVARSAYTDAVALLKTTLHDPVASRSDDTLAAVLMLDVFDTLHRRYGDFVDVGTHQQGAVALLHHRRAENFKSALSQRLFTAMRSRHINYSLQAGTRVQLGPELLTDDTAVLPSAKLDLINVELADLHAVAHQGPEPLGTSSVEFYRLLIKRALDLHQKLRRWNKALPASWRPVAVPVADLHPSIVAAGVYNNMCEVYSSLNVSHTNNAARSSHAGVLRLVALCRRELEALGCPCDPDPLPYLVDELQEIVDRFCACIPYHLGNRTSFAFPHEHREYPPVPAELRRLATFVDPFGNTVPMTQEDHVRAAAAIGGYFIMTPLAGFLRAPLLRFAQARPGPMVEQLRKGQMEWVRGQMRRIQNIYHLPESVDPHGWGYAIRHLGEPSSRRIPDGDALRHAPGGREVKEVPINATPVPS